jgi:hypothetical protein
LVLKNLQKAVIAGGVASAVVLVALALALMQGTKPVPASVEENGANDNNNTGTTAATTAVVSKTAAAPTSLECHNDSSAGTTAVVVVSAKLADQASGRGIPGKQMIFTILPGNPVAISPTDGAGQVSVSMNASEFSKERSSVFIFFDGDRDYEFSSCRIDIVTPQVSTGEVAANS